MTRLALLPLLVVSACSGRPAGPATTSTTDLASTGDSEPRWTTGLILPTTAASTGSSAAGLEEGPDAAPLAAPPAAPPGTCPHGQLCPARDPGGPRRGRP